MNELLRKLLFLPEQSSTVASGIDYLHYFVITITMLGALAVTVFGGYFVTKYRRSRQGRAGQEGRHSRLAEPTPAIPPRLEFGVILGLLALFVLWWVIGFRQYIELRIAPEGAQQVYVTGKKWMWHFAYPDGRGSAGVLYVPANEPISLIMTSRDVIHSFFVPEFRIKQDLVPGRYTTVWFEAVRPGVYPILCTEFCGTGHSTMRGQVVVLAPGQYEQWLAGTGDDATADPARQPTGETVPFGLVAMGRAQVVRHGCLRCHTVDGTAHIGPTFAGLYRSRVPLEDGTSVVADEAFITESMMDPEKRVHEGFRPVMPAYFGLQPGDTAAIIEYIKSLRDVPHEPVRQKAWL
jgi:cytochrome c oxidase subunit II